MNISTIKKLEFDKILNIIAEYAASSLAVEEILALEPIFDLKIAQSLLDCTEEMYLAINKYNASLFLELDDVLPHLKKADVGGMLQAGELLKIAKVIRGARISKKELLATGEGVVLIKNAIVDLPVNSEIEEAIGEAIANDNEIKDSASDELRSIRRRLVTASSRLKEKLASYTRQSSIAKYLQDAIVTVRNGRFVVPVKSEFREHVPGIVHDKSSGGATLFVEPIAVVELNNQLKSLELEEMQEVERILKQLSSMVASVSNNVQKCQESLVMLDIIRAKMLFGTNFKATKPLLNNKGVINLKKSRHPLIGKNAVVPVDLSLGKDKKLLLISGPNTGGKTVCLKTVGLFCLMAASGIFLPCEHGSEISIFDNVFADIGDSQSIVNSLSTFSSHLLNIVDITNNVTSRSLVLLDELGSGTDPSEGAALALGVIEFLENKGAVGIVTTHYGALKQYAINSKNILNVCMRFDQISLKPTYQLISGIPGASHALNIASALGLRQDIIKSAKNNLSSEVNRLEETLSFVEKAKAEAVEELNKNRALRQRADKELLDLEKARQELDAKKQAMGQNARAELRRIIGGNLEEADELVDQIKEKVKQADEKSLFEARQIKSKLEKLQYLDAADSASGEELTVGANSYKELQQGDIFIGAKVFASALNCIVEVISLPNKRGELTVVSGSARGKVNVSSLKGLQKSVVKNDKRIGAGVGDGISGNKSNYGGDKNVASSGEQQEVKLLGMTVSEAIEVLEPLIMSSIGSKSVLRIVHGKGTGALGKGIQKYLRSVKGVGTVRYGGYGEGETGVTIVEF